MNAYQPSVGSIVNVYPCNGNDGDQKFDILSPAGTSAILIRRAGTNLCLDMDSRNANTRMKLWNCMLDNSNQRFTSTYSDNSQQLRDQAARDQAARNQAARDQAARNQAARDQAARNQAARDQAARDQAARNQAAQLPSSGQITLPFKSGQTWYVCQGYNGPISHRNSYSLDLSIGRDVGATACYAADGNVSRSANQPVIAPAGGKISHVNTDLVCLSIDSNRSLLIGHMNQRVAIGSVVKQGDVLGYTSAANSVNGGFSHIHLEGRKSSNCAIGTSTPLTDANKLQLFGIGDLSGNATHFGKSLTRP